MADQISTRLHPACQAAFDRFDALAEIVNTLKTLSDTYDPKDARRVSGYLDVAIGDVAAQIRRVVELMGQEVLMPTKPTNFTIS